MPVRWLSGLALLIALQMSIACAAEADTKTDTQPDADLLEFLGEWETPDGAWFDPLPDDKDGQDSDQDKEKQDDQS